MRYPVVFWSWARKCRCGSGDKVFYSHCGTSPPRWRPSRTGLSCTQLRSYFDKPEVEHSRPLECNVLSTSCRWMIRWSGSANGLLQPSPSHPEKLPLCKAREAKFRNSASISISNVLHSLMFWHPLRESSLVCGGTPFWTILCCFRMWRCNASYWGEREWARSKLCCRFYNNSAPVKATWPLRAGALTAQCIPSDRCWPMAQRCFFNQ